MDEWQYLLDANCLITPNNDYYNPKFKLSKAFWDGLANDVISKRVIILTKVEKEVQVGYSQDDFLNTWLRKVHSHIEDPMRDEEVIESYRRVLKYISEQRLFQPRAQQDWAREEVADPWLIASAMSHQRKIITFEKFVPIVGNRPAAHAKIPTVADHFGVPCISLFDYMHHEGQY